MYNVRNSTWRIHMYEKSKLMKEIKAMVSIPMITEQKAEIKRSRYFQFFTTGQPRKRALYVTTAFFPFLTIWLEEFWFLCFFLQFIHHRQPLLHFILWKRWQGVGHCAGKHSGRCSLTESANLPLNTFSRSLPDQFKSNKIWLNQTKLIEKSSSFKIAISQALHARFST